MAAQSIATDLSDSPLQLQQLQSTVQTMDALSQAGFAEISALAQLALHWLETPRAVHDPEVIALAFGLIQGRAVEMRNSINSEAERVGCNHIDVARQQRWLAWQPVADAAA